jgi:hypothetical protein
MAQTNVLARLLSTALLLAVTSTGAFATENCQHIEMLAQQYAGVELTLSQLQVKRRLTAYYHRHCTRH